jgi:hypothetical protein
MCSVFRAIFLKELSKLEKKGKINPDSYYQAVKGEVSQKRWVVNNQYPTADSSLIENYLSRYICIFR